MMLSLRIVTFLLLTRLMVLDIAAANDWLGWLTVVFDVVLAVVILADREPRPAHTEKDDYS